MKWRIRQITANPQMSSWTTTATKAEEQKSESAAEELEATNKQQTTFSAISNEAELEITSRATATRNPMFRYQDSFPLAAVEQTPLYVLNNKFQLQPLPHYSSHFLEDSRISNPSQPCFMAKQTAAYTQAAAETFNSANGHGSQQLPTNFGSYPRTLTSQTSSPTLNIPESSTSSEIIHHPIPVYYRVKPNVRTPSGKRCRKSRTVLTNLQLRVLEKTFSEQKYLDSTHRAKLSHILCLNEAQVKTWFQNRRMKWKKKAQKAEQPDSSTTAKKAEKPTLQRK